MILHILKQNIYLYLLVLTTVEWPITSFVSAWFAAQGHLRIEYVAIVAFLWDVIGDVILYIIGRFFGKIKFLKEFSYFSKQKDFLTRMLEKSPFFYMLIVKFTPYLSTPSLLFAWTKRMKFRFFVLYSFLISILVKMVFLTMWYLWSISVRQLKIFMSWRKQVVLYIFAWIFVFFITKFIYHYIWNHLRKKIKENKILSKE